MSASEATYQTTTVVPPRSGLESRSRFAFTTFYLRSTVSTIALIRPFFTRTIGAIVERYRTGYFGWARLWSSSKSNSPTPTELGGNLGVFTYPYLISLPSPRSGLWESKSVTISTLTPGGPSLFLFLLRSTPLTPASV